MQSRLDGPCAQNGPAMSGLDQTEVRMENIEQFNLYTAHILSTLYAHFPMPKALEASAIVDSMKAVIPASGDSQKDLNNFVGHTLLWLTETGYVMRHGDLSPPRYVLAPKAFEVMNALPSALQGKEPAKGEKSMGAALTEVTKELGKEVGKEMKKEAAKRIVGELFGYGLRTFLAP